MTGETIQRIAEFAGLEVHFTPDPDRFFDLLHVIARPLAGDDVWPWLASRPSQSIVG